ncbi:bifunctional ornithine acetyltransferase/N-acetylglutamate synthase [Leptothoe sp. PORK10 BA2]|uniref:bifunctional ornithine acetyltransferase/N-acetylglutamate synthase n=1 Tax=Leptothoe sp. PORK10 BA2 TaxID=3110254 RepID=UPI002B1F07AE|nr:bifunctional ornithine acetyltransferase/N-acetylglutamate synthase [Leptothoe sp. PORK10 BA2]MEA5462800.1 bifunctional ornithine acetyltransferase/N-acetylglutamate synthase [Leptothoe sp. PORK10 BA2]
MAEGDNRWQVIMGGVTAPKGFTAAGIKAGLKASGSPDLALIVSENDAIAAAVYTQSQVRAACVDYCQQQLENQPSARAILCNSGQANACTGQQGWADAATMAAAAAAAIGTTTPQVLIASTGVIGQRIKMEPLLAHMPQLTAELSDQGGDAVARAILTTDLVPKTYALETTIDGRPVRIGGIAKGSGMIHPNMATMLCFITCDAAVSPSLWQAMLTRAVDQSFNQITVDGDTSTNDTVIALANGQSRTPAITTPGPDAERLEAMVTELCIYLAKSIARDGEGATCLIEVQASGTATNQEARKIARTVAGSSLVKSAIFGRDPNWGRIAGAAGRAGVTLDQAELTIALGDFVLLDQGQPQAFDPIAAHTYLKQCAELSSAAFAQQKQAFQSSQINDLATGSQAMELQAIATEALAHPVKIAVRVGDGAGMGKAWGCDLSYDYVKINAEYTT